MGNCFGRRRKIRDVKIASFGLDGSGKTTIVKALKGEENQRVISTVGFNAVHLMQNRMNVTIYDLGGGPRIRDIWPSYFSEIFGTIYVVDAQNEQRIEETKAAFLAVISNDLMRGKPILLLLNKQDLDGAIDEVDAAERMDLQKIVNLYETPCRIETCFGTSGTGKVCDPRIRSGFQWLLEQIEAAYDRLEERVERDFAEMKARQQSERRERLARLKAREEENESDVLDDPSPLTSSTAMQSNGDVVKTTSPSQMQSPAAIRQSSTAVALVHNDNLDERRASESLRQQYFYPPHNNLQPISYADPRQLDHNGGGPMTPKGIGKNRILPFEPLPQIREESLASSHSRTASIRSRVGGGGAAPDNSTPATPASAATMTQSRTWSLDDSSTPSAPLSATTIEPAHGSGVAGVTATTTAYNRVQTTNLGTDASFANHLPPISPQIMKRLPPVSPRSTDHMSVRSDPDANPSSISEASSINRSNDSGRGRKRKRKRLDSLTKTVPVAAVEMKTIDELRTMDNE